MKPTAIKILEGNRGQKELNLLEPKFQILTATVPDWLDTAAVVEWNRMFPLLAANGIITEADLAAFAIYCQSFSDYGRLTKEIRTEGELIDDCKGSWKKNPLLAAKSQAFHSLSILLQQFGFTPNARQKIIGTDDSTPGPLEGSNWF